MSDNEIQNEFDFSGTENISSNEREVVTSKEFLSEISFERYAALIDYSVSGGFVIPEDEVKFFSKHVQSHFNLALDEQNERSYYDKQIRELGKNWVFRRESEQERIQLLISKSLDKNRSLEERCYFAYLTYTFKHDPEDIAGRSLETFKDKIYQNEQLMEKYLDAYPEFSSIKEEWTKMHEVRSKAIEESDKERYRYYLTERPVSIGTQPEGFIEMHNFDYKSKWDDTGFESYGWVEYDHELKSNELETYSLRKPQVFIEIEHDPDWHIDEDLMEEITNANKSVAPSTSIWGMVDNYSELIPGVYLVGTASHGGIMVHNSVARKFLSKEAFNVGDREGKWLSYEEDCDANVVLLELYRNRLMDGFEWNKDRKAEMFKFSQESAFKWNNEYWTEFEKNMKENYMSHDTPEIDLPDQGNEKDFDIKLDKEAASKIKKLMSFTYKGKEPGKQLKYGFLHVKGEEIEATDGLQLLSFKMKDISTELDSKLQDNDVLSIKMKGNNCTVKKITMINYPDTEIIWKNISRIKKHPIYELDVDSNAVRSAIKQMEEEGYFNKKEKSDNKKYYEAWLQCDESNLTLCGIKIGRASSSFEGRIPVRTDFLQDILGGDFIFSKIQVLTDIREKPYMMIRERNEHERTVSILPDKKEWGIDIDFNEFMKNKNKETNEILTNFEKNKKIITTFDQMYNVLYEYSGAESLGEKENVNLFDRLIENNQKFRELVSELAKQRGDFFSSDRECAALVLSLKDLGMGEYLKTDINIEQKEPEKVLNFDNKQELLEYQASQLSTGTAGGKERILEAYKAEDNITKIEKIYKEEMGDHWYGSYSHDFRLDTRPQKLMITCSIEGKEQEISFSYKELAKATVNYIKLNENKFFDVSVVKNTDIQDSKTNPYIIKNGLEVDNTAERFVENLQILAKEKKNYSSFALASMLIMKMRPEDKAKTVDLLKKEKCYDKKSVDDFLARVTNVKAETKSKENESSLREKD